MKSTKKLSKRILCLVLSVLMVLPFCLPASAALSLADPETNLTTLREQFRTGYEGPSDGGHAVKYSYFSPIGSNYSDKTKYPVVFFIGNTYSNANVNAELKETSFPLWSSAEYQARFYDAGGAYLVFMRIPNASIFNQHKISSSIMYMARDFVSKNNANIDVNRLYLVSWDEGAEYAFTVVADNPGYFQALVAMSTDYVPSTTEISKLATTPIWYFTCKTDSSISFTQSEATWGKIVAQSTTETIYNSRYTTFESFNTIGTKLNHTTWEYAAYDMHYPNDTTGMKTINAKGNSISFSNTDEGMISWMSKLGSNYGSGCSCPCHGATGLAKFLWLLKWMISMMLKIERNRICECGVAHW